MFSGIFGIIAVFLISLVVQKICDYFKDLKRDLAFLKLTPEQRRSIEWEEDLDGSIHWALEKDGQLPSQTDEDIIEFHKKYG